MNDFTITTDSTSVREALREFARRVKNADPVLHTIGTGVIERTKRRFDTSTGPDGQPWKPNSAATIQMISARLGKGFRKKSGELSAKGNRRVAGKKPLIGESGDLRRQLVKAVVANSLTITSTPPYGAIQQFGGKTGVKSWIPGKTIPARPFLPVRKDGSVYPADEAEILRELNAYFAEGL